MKSELLDAIHSREDLCRLPKEKMPDLCAEIRERLVDSVMKTGGHLASNLGVTELTVAMHRVFDCPTDHFIFDVGHQSYVHKMLTGRLDRFDSLRTPGGLSGFTTRREGPSDAFGAGHSSTAVSAALGFAEADKLSGSDAFTVAVVGDGAYTGGMVHEALNNVKTDLKLVIILNENGMSISDNKGAFASFLSRVRVSARYNRWKTKTKRRLESKPKIGRKIEKILGRIRDRLKRAFYRMNYFEELGLYYIGPVDGNDYAAVERALAKARMLSAAVVVHVRTVKGKGYLPAETAPEKFHSVRVTPQPTETFHSVFAKELTAEAEEDPRIVAVTAAMGSGTGLDLFGATYPDRYFDVGIAEEHALTFSAGLAAAGLSPYAVIYSTFLQRAYDSILHDVALQNLPVRMIIDRAGFALSDGATHHGIFDVSFLSSIPGIRILAPASFGSLVAMMKEIREATVPTALRYPDAGENAEILAAFFGAGDYENVGLRCDFDPEYPPEYLFISYGNVTARALGAERLIAERGLSAGTVLLEELAPYDRTCERLRPLLRRARRVLFVEEGIRTGGAGMILGADLSDAGALPKDCLYDVAATDSFAIPDEPCDLFRYLGLDEESLAHRMLCDR